MEHINNILNSMSTKEKNSIGAILRAVFLGRATQEEIDFYKNNYMNDVEKSIGKPFFEMNGEEEKRYKEMSYNSQAGDLQGYDCTKCKNRGDFLYIDDKGYEIYQSCSCIAIRRTIRRMKECGLDNLLSLYTFDKYKCEEDWQKDTYEKAREFVTSDKNWFAMLGSSGSGKSHICTAISRELLKQGKELKYMMWLDDSTILKQCKANDPKRYEEMIKELKNIEVLYIDDFFKDENDTKPSSADIKLANELLNYRYNKARMDNSKRWITIISSERTIEQLLTYDTALGGRIVEMTKPNNLIMLFGAEKNYRLR